MGDFDIEKLLAEQGGAPEAAGDRDGASREGSATDAEVPGGEGSATDAEVPDGEGSATDAEVPGGDGAVDLTSASGVRMADDADLDDHARYDRATFAFETKDYLRAAALLEPLAEADPGNAEVRLLLARSYYHSARLGRAETELRALLERWPSEAYAHLVLARTLQRAGRAEEGAPHLKIAEAMGLEA